MQSPVITKPVALMVLELRLRARARGLRARARARLGLGIAGFLFTCIRVAYLITVTEGAGVTGVLDGIIIIIV